MCSSDLFVLSLLFITGFLNVRGQQKANDFTKRVGAIDGKMSSLSGRPSSFNRMSPSSSRRISVEDWPEHFSPFGGKRFPLGNAKIWGSERIPDPRIEITTPLNDRIAKESFVRANNDNISRRAPAANSVEFREAYYAQLNKRVDDWMEKVNNLSLQDVNRYQFRKGRSNKPGFPVQRAGAESRSAPATKAPLQDAALFRGGATTFPQGSKDYWMGPRRIKSSGSTSGFSAPAVSPQSSSGGSWETDKNFKIAPKPILGPKTIRVEVGKPE